jgi:hypothetical protein
MPSAASPPNKRERLGYGILERAHVGVLGGDLNYKRPRLLSNVHSARIARDTNQRTQPVAAHLRVGCIFHLAHKALYLGYKQRQNLDLEARIAPRVSLELGGVEQLDGWGRHFSRFAPAFRFVS